MKHIIFDCDSTVGLPEKPMDDALALLYLLGCEEEADILGITCTFGNGTVAEVTSSTAALLREIGRTDIPLLAGAERGADPRSDAAHFIVETVRRAQGDVSLLALGSLTNLYGAYLLAPDIFAQVREVVLMGGYTAPLLYHGRHLEELNFSAHPAASDAVLRHAQRLSVLTGNNTLLPSHLPQEEFCAALGEGYIAQKCGYRFHDKLHRHGEAVSYCWDVIAAVYLLHPELFDPMPSHCFFTERTLHSGWLGLSDPAPDTVALLLPQVRDLARYRAEMYRAWQRFSPRDAV